MFITKEHIIQTAEKIGFIEDGIDRAVLTVPDE